MQSPLSSVAEQYARALLDVLEGRPERERGQSEAELEALAGALKGAPDLQQFLRNPIVGRQAKQKAFERALPSAQEVVRRFLGVLVERGRADLLPEVHAAYLRQRDERRGVLVAEVTSAAALGREARERCEAALREATGREVRLEPVLDPALIGGVRTRIGSRVFDGSVRARLDALRRRLLGD